MKVLIAGWFSFEDGHATAGDELAADVLRQWLDEAGLASVTATTSPSPNAVDWREVDPAEYPVVVFVCGPFEKKGHEAEFFRHFSASRVVGLNLSLADSIDQWNPFDLLLERDSPQTGRPDVVFGAPRKRVPLVGVCRVEDYPGGLTGPAHQAIDELLGRFEAARIPIDTRLDINSANLRTKSEVEAAIAGMDLIVTTRLHGTVLALKNGVPALPIDPVPGGAKIIRQAQTINWPICFSVDRLSAADLDQAFRYCLTEEARSTACACAKRATDMLETLREEFITGLQKTVSDDTRTSLRDRSRAELRDRLSAQSSPPSARSLGRTVEALWARLKKTLPH